MRTRPVGGATVEVVDLKQRCARQRRPDPRIFRGLDRRIAHAIPVRPHGCVFAPGAPVGQRRAPAQTRTGSESKSEMQKTHEVSWTPVEERINRAAGGDLLRWRDTLQ